MREVILKQWCDPCHAELEAYTEATVTVTVSLGGTPHTLDMCENHRKSIIDPLGELLETHGRPPNLAPHELLPVQRSGAGARRAPDSTNPMWTCPLCSESMNRTSAIGHIYSRHHPAGTVRPMHLTCTTCAKQFEHRQGCMTHMIKTHGYQPVVEALKGAR